MNHVASQLGPAKIPHTQAKRPKRRRPRLRQRPEKQPLTEDELNRELYEAGVIDNIPLPASARPPRQQRKLIKVRGPILTSELLIAERR